MKGKLMKSLFRGKAGVPRTPGGPVMPEDQEDDGLSGRLRLHSAEGDFHSTNSLNESPSSESPRSWPSTFTTPMSYIKERKKRKASKFHIASPFDGDESKDQLFGSGAEEHNLSQSLHSDSLSFASVSDSPHGGEEEGDGGGASRHRGDAQLQHQLRLQVELQQKVIADLEAAKAAAEGRVGELEGQVERSREEASRLREEVQGKKRLEIVVQDLREKLQHFESENRNLQQRVNESSPLTDHQKELLLQNRLKPSSAPPSIMAGSLEGAAGGLADSGEELSNEWEVKSSGGSSVHSHVSVACLQDKLVQMEENNYSTHEELQATLQELTDLQHQLEELQTENRTLGDEKALLYESLCQQTEKLEACRSQLESTRQLLLQREDSARMGQTEKEGKLMDVLKSAQDERDRLESRSCELAATVEELRQGGEAMTRDMAMVQERKAFLERTLHSVRKEKEHAERELADVKGDLGCKARELSRLQAINENFKTKLEALEAARDVVDKTEIEAKLDELRREKDGLEAAVSEAAQHREKAEFEVAKVRDAAAQHQHMLEKELEKEKEKAAALEEKLARLRQEKARIAVEVADLQNSVTELEVKCQHHLTDKRELRANLSEVQKRNDELQESFKCRMTDMEGQLSTERTRRMSECEEWRQFQADLLMTVRVANDFQTEAQTNLEQTSEEMQELRDRVRSLEGECDKLKSNKLHQEALQQERLVEGLALSPAQAAVKEVTEGLTSLRSKYSRSQSADNKATVKGLIDSIESAAKAKTASYTRSSSTPAMVPTLSPIAEVSKAVFVSSASPVVRSSEERTSEALATLQEEPVAPATPVSILSHKAVTPRAARPLFDPRTLPGDDPLAALVKNGGSKRNALLKWCQSKVGGYVDVDITNFSSSWNDGMAFAALLHGYVPDKIPYSTLKPSEKRRNFTIAFEAAEAVGIGNTLNLTEMVSIERPDWQQIMTYVTNIYKHFET